MAIDRIVQGQSAQFEIELRTDTGATLVLTEPARWTIRDHTGGLIDEGVGAQDQANPAKWSAFITIPASAPASPDGTRYSITWVGKSVAGIQKETERFTVVGTSNFGSDLVELDQLILEKSVLQDTLYVDSLSTVNEYTMRLLTLEGETLYEFTNNAPTPASTQGDLKAYSHRSAAPVLGMEANIQGFRSLVIEWSFSLDGVSGYKEYHFLYVANPKMLAQIREVRLLIDKGRRNHPNPALNYTDLDIAGYLGQGAQYLNSIKPVLTNWSPNTVPNEFSLSLVYAAAYTALTAQYLAEGSAAFDFSGQAVSLSVDRTQFIEATLQRFKDYLDSQVPTLKRMWVRSGGSGGGQGILGINFGPSTPYSVRDARYMFYRQYMGGTGLIF